MPAACSRQDSSVNINGLLCPHQPCALHTHASARAQERRRFRATKNEEDLGRGHHAAKDEDDSSKLISVLAQRVARHVLAAPGSPAVRQSCSRAVVQSGALVESKHRRTALVHALIGVGSATGCVSVVFVEIALYRSPRIGGQTRGHRATVSSSRIIPGV